MAKKWCGFSVQNEVIKHNWDQLVQMQNEPPQTVELDTYELDEPGSEPSSPEPVPIKTAKPS